MKFCDAQRKSTLEPIPLTEMELNSPKNLEKNHVKNVYDAIAVHWDSTRHSPWKQVKNYVINLKEGSIVADIGCGNGRYMDLAPQCVIIGCDISIKLIEICRNKNFEAFVADALDLPFISNRFDHSLSIAVLHHLATVENRIKVLTECVRIIKPGGESFFCAWALEQEENSKRVFNQQDMMVPWQMQKRFGDQNTYLRYCHLYKKGEIEELLQNVPNIDIINSFYDSSNWCVIVKKRNPNNTN